MLGYEYVDLNPRQLQQRRALLDQAGSIGVKAPFVILALVWVVRKSLSPASNTNKITDQDRKKDDDIDLKQPSSSPPPQQSPFTRRLKWTLSTTYLTPEFGPLHVVLTGLAYALFLLYLITRNTGNDYMHLTKAFGHVAVSQLPIHYLLSLKDSRSPIVTATGLTHERLNAYHRLFGRILHLLLAVHATLYLKFFVDKGVLLKRLADLDVQLGVLAFWTLNFLAILAIPPVRKAVYHRVFYRSHVTLSLALLAVVYFHVPYTRSHVQQAGLAWVVNGLLRTMVSEEVEQLECRKIGGEGGAGGLIEVVARVPEANWKKWVPGMHGYLNQGPWGARNPYTVVSVDAVSNGKSDVKMVVRNLGGPGTEVLGRKAERKEVGEKVVMQLEGPYGEAEKYMPGLTAQGRQSGKILVVAGGIGATYSLPVYLALLKARANQTEGLRLVWIVKSMEDATWGLEKLCKVGAPVDVHLFVSQAGSKDPDRQEDLKISGLHVSKTGSRPKTSAVVDDFFAVGEKNGKKDVTSASQTGKVTVMVCGPPGLSKSLRKAVGKHVMQHDRDVDWYEEQFGFGGS